MSSSWIALNQSRIFCAVLCILLHLLLESRSGKLSVVILELTLIIPRSLSGLALRQCIELGYYRSARKFGLALGYLRLEMRNKVFWCSYGNDRAASMTLGRPFGISDQEIDIEVGTSKPSYIKVLIILLVPIRY